MSQEAAHDVCMLQYLILSILKQGNWASFILTLKNEKVISFFEFFFFFNKFVLYLLSHHWGLQMNLSYTAWSILIKSATLIRGDPFPDAGQWRSF